MSIPKNENTGVKLDKELILSNDFPVPTYSEWKESAEKLLKGQAFEKKLVTKTDEGIDLNPIYVREHLSSLSFLGDMPGNGSYIRGTKKDGYLNQSWDICQEIHGGTLTELNLKLRDALKRGQTAIVLDLEKLDIRDMKDMSVVFDQIDLKHHALYIKTGFSSNRVLNLILAFAGEKGITLNGLNGYIAEDPIAYLAENGSLPKGLDEIYLEMESSIKLAADKLPNFRVIGINGDLYHNAGADSVRELAISMATAVEYLNQMLDKGIDINTAAKQIYFIFGIGTHFFMEVSKLRAARVLWQKIVESYGGDEESQKMFIHAKSSVYYHTKLDPHVNTLRTTTETFSAIVGGADAITTRPYDAISGESSDLAIRIARNIQIILKEESNLEKLIDPAGGSYYVETLTEEIVKKAWESFQNIEKEGGMLTALKQEHIHQEIERVVQNRQKALFKRKQVVVGTNMFVNLADEIDHDKESPEVSGKLEKDSDLTVRRLDQSRLAEPFEAMRSMVAEHAQKSGKLPVVYLANFGSVKQYKARADFSRGYFEVGGFDVIYSDGSRDIDTVAANAAESKSDIVVLCSDDPSYPEIIETFVSTVKKENSDVSIILAGFPGKSEEQYRQWGLDGFIYMGSDLYHTLESLLNKSGVNQ